MTRHLHSQLSGRQHDSPAKPVLHQVRNMLQTTNCKLTTPGQPQTVPPPWVSQLHTLILHHNPSSETTRGRFAQSVHPQSSKAAAQQCCSATPVPAVSDREANRAGLRSQNACMVLPHQQCCATCQSNNSGCARIMRKRETSQCTDPKKRDRHKTTDRHTV